MHDNFIFTHGNFIFMHENEIFIPRFFMHETFRTGIFIMVNVYNFGVLTCDRVRRWFSPDIKVSTTTTITYLELLASFPQNLASNFLKLL